MLARYQDQLDRLRDYVAHIEGERLTREAMRVARYHEVVRLREQGKSLREIGDLIGVTGERVRQIILERGRPWSLPPAIELREAA